MEAKTLKKSHSKINYFLLVISYKTLILNRSKNKEKYKHKKVHKRSQNRFFNKNEKKYIRQVGNKNMIFVLQIFSACLYLLEIDY